MSNNTCMRLLKFYKTRVPPRPQKTKSAETESRIILAGTGIDFVRGCTQKISTLEKSTRPPFCTNTLSCWLFPSELFLTRSLLSECWEENQKDKMWMEIGSLFRKVWLWLILLMPFVHTTVADDAPSNPQQKVMNWNGLVNSTDW